MNNHRRSEQPTNDTPQIDEILTIGFMYGIQSDLLHAQGKDNELRHRVKGFQNTEGFAEARTALLDYMEAMLDRIEQEPGLNCDGDIYMPLSIVKAERAKITELRGK